MKEHNKTREGKGVNPIVQTLVTYAFGLAIGVLGGVRSIAPYVEHLETRGNYITQKNKHIMIYDVDKDGLADVVSADGSVEISQEDGSCLSLKTVMENHVDRIKKSYHLEKGEGGRYYTKGALESQE